MWFISLLIESICFLASISLYFQVSIPQYLKTFPFFLLMTIIVEIVGVSGSLDRASLNFLYCFFTAFEFEYYLLIIRFSINNPKAKKIISWALTIYPLLVLINIFFIQPEKFHTNTYSLGCLLVVAACIYYIFEIFQSKHSVNLAKEPPFWICSGLLFFYCCTFPLIGLWNQLPGLPDIILSNLNAILQILNILLYSLFSIAFLCRIRIRRSLQ
jgi:Ca2+/Na+ antiporter